MISYLAGAGREKIQFSDDVLAHFARHRQLDKAAREAGGQLFARFREGLILIEQATGPRRLDRRSRHSFHPSRVMERIEICRLYRRGLYYVGDWHTHPEQFPVPSQDDFQTIQDIFKCSRHLYSGIILAIVGQSSAAQGLYVAIADGQSLHELILHSTEDVDDGG